MSLARQLKIILMLFKMKLSRNMAFRFSFFGVFFVDGSLFIIQILMFRAIYSAVGSIGGWDGPQMLFFIGTFSLIDSLNMATYFFGVSTIPDKIKSGKLDLYITKPINSLLHISFESMDPGSVPMVIASIGMLVFAASGMNTPVTAVKAGGYSFLIIMMVVLLYDTEVIFHSIPFFVIKTESIERLESEVIMLCIRIPGTLFKGAFKVLFCLVLPYGIMATVPAQFFFDALTPAGLMYSIGIAAAFTAFTIYFWKFGLRNYKSASS